MPLVQCEHSNHDAAGLPDDPLFADCPDCHQRIRIYGPPNDRRWSPHNLPPDLGAAISGMFSPEMDEDAALDERDRLEGLREENERQMASFAEEESA